MEEKLKEELTCSVCLDLPRKEVYQCKNGHIVCKSCYRNLHDCPECRVVYGAEKIRNRTAERVIRAMKSTANKTTTGQQELEVPNRSRENSIDSSNWSFGVNFCQQFGYDCNHTVFPHSLRTTLEHLVDSHKFLISFDSTVTIALDRILHFKQNSPNMWIPVIVDRVHNEGVAFIVLSLFDAKSQTVSFLSVRSNDISGRSVESTYKVQFTVKLRNKNQTENIASCSGLPFRLMDTFIATQNPYRVYSIADLTKNLLKGGELLLEISVAKVNTQEVVEQPCSSRTSISSVSNLLESQVPEIIETHADSTYYFKDGHNDQIIGNGGHVIQTGFGNLRVTGNLERITQGGAAELVMAGNLEKGIQLNGVGRIHLSGNIRGGGIILNGSGEVEVHGNVNGNIKVNGPGLVTVFGYHFNGAICQSKGGRVEIYNH